MMEKISFFTTLNYKLKDLKQLVQQTEVNFDVVETEKGLRAVNITVA